MAEAARTTIELRDAEGMVTARVVPGRPCRASVDGVELLVGAQPLVAQHGAARWTGEDAANGTTFKKNDAAIARIHARQLFDGEGTPILRVLDNGDLADPAGAIVGRATATGRDVTVRQPRGDATVTNTHDVVLAAMLAARAASPEVRALAACHLLFSSEKSS